MTPAFRHGEVFSFKAATRDQAETDRYWNAIVGNGDEAQRAVEAMMEMKNIDPAAIEAACREV